MSVKRFVPLFMSVHIERPNQMDDAFLVFLSGALAVSAQLKLPFQEVLSFWRNLETCDVTNHLGDEDVIVSSTYSEVFRNPAVLAKWGSVFVPLNQNSIQSVSTAAPFTITTAFPHGFHTGMQVRIGGVVADASANGMFTIAVASATSFTLNGYANNGAWTAGGVATGILSGSIIPNNITSVSTTSPFTITTELPHGFQTGMQVVIDDVTADPNANGTFTITVASRTSLTLNG